MANESLFQKNHSDIDLSECDNNIEGPIFMQYTDRRFINEFGYEYVLEHPFTLAKTVDRISNHTYILYFSKNKIELRVVKEDDFRKVSYDASRAAIGSTNLGMNELKIEQLIHRMSSTYKTLIVFHYDAPYSQFKESITFDRLYELLKDLYNNKIEPVIKSHQRCLQLGGNNHD